MCRAREQEEELPKAEETGQLRSFDRLMAEMLEYCRRKFFAGWGLSF